MTKWMKQLAVVTFVGLMVWGCPWDKKKDESNPTGPDTTATGQVTVNQTHKESGDYQVSGSVLVLMYNDTSKECNDSTLVTNISSEIDTINFSLSSNGNTMTATSVEYQGDSSNCPETTIVTLTRTGGGSSVVGTWTIASFELKSTPNCADPFQTMLVTGVTMTGTLTIDAGGTYQMNAQMNLHLCLATIYETMFASMVTDTSLHVTATGCSKVSVTHPSLTGPVTITANSDNTVTVHYLLINCTSNILSLLEEPTSCPRPEDACLGQVISAIGGSPKALRLPKLHF